MFDGPASPATQTFGLGMSRLPTEEELDRLEAFFTERGAPVYHEVSPLADEKLVPMLTATRLQALRVHESCWTG